MPILLGKDVLRPCGQRNCPKASAVSKPRKPGVRQRPPRVAVAARSQSPSVGLRNKNTKQNAWQFSIFIGQPTFVFRSNEETGVLVMRSDSRRRTRWLIHRGGSFLLGFESAKGKRGGGAKFRWESYLGVGRSSEGRTSFLERKRVSHTFPPPSSSFPLYGMAVCTNRPLSRAHPPCRPFVRQCKPV